MTPSQRPAAGNVPERDFERTESIGEHLLWAHTVPQYRAKTSPIDTARWLKSLSTGRKNSSPVHYLEWLPPAECQQIMARSQPEGRRQITWVFKRNLEAVGDEAAVFGVNA
jgi:hypothetical protein